jgi:hypothetical protein
MVEGTITNDSPAGTSSATDESRLDAAIGRRFPVSPSIAEKCGKRDEVCEEVYGILEEFAEQPRNPPWAAKIESVLRERVLTEEPGKYVIRSIECRVSACAVEVESRFGLLFGGGYEFESKNGLLSGPELFAYETSKDGERVTVTLMPYRRR